MNSVERFLRIADTYKSADEHARRDGINTIEGTVFESVLSDLKNIIPELSGIWRGRALLLMGQCAHYLKLYSQSRISFNDFFNSLSAPPDPQLIEGLTCAKEGRKLLVLSGGEKSEIAWADDVIKALEEYCK